MNILITNDDGPGAYGLEVLQGAVQAVYPEARIVTLTQKQGRGGQGLAITPVDAEALPIETVEPDVYICDGTPADLIYAGVGMSRRFLADGQFDLVLTGVNHGHNVGMDVFHSGTVGMAMLAVSQESSSRRAEWMAHEPRNANNRHGTSVNAALTAAPNRAGPANPMDGMV